MLTIFNGSDGYPISQDDYYIRELASGYDEVIFHVNIRDPIYQYVREEAIIRDRDQNEYIIKQIDAGNTTAKVVAQVNLDAWKSQLYMDYSNNSATVTQTVQSVLPSGWSIWDYSGVTKRRTIPEDDTADYNVTALEVLEACTSVYEVRFRFDVANKKISIINPKSYVSAGAFATRDLNLKALNYKGKSDTLVTRLYAEGADGLTFASINDGKAYVENRTYVNKIICGFWKDERYTNAQSLLEDAQAKVDELSRPSQSYDCDVLDLANTNPEMYGFEDFSLFEVVTLIDDAREERADYQVVERWTYPYYPVKNKVILSEATPNIQSTIQTVVTSISSPTSGFQQIMQAAIANATSLITGNKGGYVVFHDSDDDGYPDEILVMNTPDIATARKVWRWNNSGLGYSSTGYDGSYGLAMTINGAIVANFITTGTLNAERIKAGRIEDLQNKNYWDLESGEFALSATTTVGGSTVPTIASNAANSAVDSYDTRLNQQAVFNKLTNNGTVQGIYLTNGELYINGTYIKSGTIDAQYIKAGKIEDKNQYNYWDLDTGAFKLSATTQVGNSTIASDADVSSAVNTLDGSLNQAEVFKRLTNNGQLQGLYMQNNNLYINASYIQTGDLNAARITAGILKDANNYNSWNLATGDFSLSANTTVGGSTVSTIASGAASSAVDNYDESLDQQEVFNKLTDSAQNTGIYLKANDNQLYINATYIATGTITGHNSGFSLNMDTGQFTLSNGTITGVSIQSDVVGESGSYNARLVLDDTTSIKGYYGGTMHNLINLEQVVSGTHQMTIDADTQLNIRTPHLYVVNQSAGTGTATVYETVIATDEYMSQDPDYYMIKELGKLEASDPEAAGTDVREMWVAHVDEEDATPEDVYCTLPVFLKYTKTPLKYIHGMLIGEGTTESVIV